MHVEFEVVGVKELRRQLEDLGVEFRKDATRKAHRQAIGPWRKAVRAAAPRLTGTLRRAVRSTVRVSRTSNYSAVTIMTGRGAKYDAWYWRLVEHGTRRTRPNPFVRRAFRNLQRPAGETFVQVLNDFIGEWSP